MIRASPATTRPPLRVVLAIDLVRVSTDQELNIVLNRVVSGIRRVAPTQKIVSIVERNYGGRCSMQLANTLYTTTRSRCAMDS